MRILLPVLVGICLSVGCSCRDEPLPPAVAPPSGDPQTTASQPSPQPGRVTPAEWAAHPIFEKPNPYDLPLEYEIELPELPPQGVMDPAPELPPE